MRYIGRWSCSCRWLVLFLLRFYCFVVNFYSWWFMVLILYSECYFHPRDHFRSANVVRTFIGAVYWCSRWYKHKYHIENWPFAWYAGCDGRQRISWILESNTGLRVANTKVSKFLRKIVRKEFKVFFIDDGSRNDFKNRTYTNLWCVVMFLYSKMLIVHTSLVECWYTIFTPPRWFVLFQKNHIR